jgi:5-methyltetrahydrofolate--homocysteine methyltransferase
MVPNQAVNEIIDAIIHLNGDRIAELALKAVTEGIAPLTVVNDGLSAGLRKVGDLFADEEMFLPELITAANMVSQAME